MHTGIIYINPTYFKCVRQALLSSNWHNQFTKLGQLTIINAKNFHLHFA